MEKIFVSVKRKKYGFLSVKGRKYELDFPNSWDKKEIQEPEISEPKQIIIKEMSKAAANPTISKIKDDLNKMKYSSLSTLEQKLISFEMLNKMHKGAKENLIWLCRYIAEQAGLHLVDSREMKLEIMENDSKLEFYEVGPTGRPL
ncbi:hypothetical protein [Bacillus cereus group sp. TH152-1LC]|uniref:hypothetical protein n=1 Tax=Bacillus cereus group sp. TH152-1LC TaxID=3018060 RepID=UPI0022E48C5C|nr:hypothetical protein [Bacillus cereus group sp. TH152-1LC]MDA1675204.1 hypothetical protein [Bacillus cereus group sp. TH152-1LC]